MRSIFGKKSRIHDDGNLAARRRLFRMRRKRQAGIALIAVLLLVITGTSLATMVMAISKSSAFTVRPFVQLQRSFYVNEGMAARIQYLISAERQLFGSVSLQEDNYIDYNHDRYLPDCVPHTMNYYGTWVTFTIQDGSSPVTLTDDYYRDGLAEFNNYSDDDYDMEELITFLQNRIQDYMDSDDTPIDDDSYEIDEYYDLFNAYPLPRNSAILDRNEYGYIPELKTFFPVDRDGRLSYIRLIPPAIAGVTLDGNPDIWGVTDDWLYYCAGLEEDEIEELRMGIEELNSVERVPLTDSVDEEILNKLGNFVRWDTTDVITVTIRPAQYDEKGEELAEKTPGKRLVFTYSNQPIGGAESGTVPFYEWMWF